MPLRGEGAPPGPRGREVLDFFGGGSAQRMLGFLERMARRFGPVSSFRILNRRIWVVDDPELIQEVLVTRQHEFIRDSGATLLRELLGDGLLTSDEPRHRERRRMLQPAFHRERIAGYAAAMAREAERVAENWRQGAEIDVRAQMRALTLAVAGECLFGTAFAGSAGRIAAVLDKVGKRLAMLAPFMAFFEGVPLAYRRLFPGGASLFFPSERAELERIVAPLVERRRQAGGADLLSVLLSLRDDAGGALSAEDVRNEVVTLVLAGHETTSTALTWTWFLLAAHPQVESKLRHEIDSVLGGRLPGFDDIARLPYTGMVFAETLRLYPPAPVFGRRPRQDVTLGGYRAAAGTAILLSPYITQRNPKFFERPESFEPERWEGAVPPRFAYFPFGGGAKMCLGDGFARTEAVVVLAVLARRWRLEAAGDARMRPLPDLTSGNGRPARLRLVRRVTPSSGEGSTPPLSRPEPCCPP